ETGKYPCFGKRQNIGTVVVLDTQYDRGLRAFDLPVPVLRMNEPARGCRPGKRDQTRAAVRILRCGLALRPALCGLEQFGSGVEQNDARIVDVGTFSNTAHLVHIGRVEGGNGRLETGGDLLDVLPAQLALFQLHRIVLNPASYPDCGLFAVLPTAFA